MDAAHFPFKAEHKLGGTGTRLMHDPEPSTGPCPKEIHN